MSNFLFLKKNNANLFGIIFEAEKLFADEYFEQAVIQARRFAENLCRDLLQNKALPDDTFDSMINKIKDNSFGNIRMKEFSEDLYFLKKHGNNSAHSSVVVKNAAATGKIALECLERAYEIAVFYSNVKFGYDKKLDKTVFSEELLMTGKKTGAKSSPKILREKYSDELKKTRAAASKTKPKKTPKTDRNGASRRVYKKTKSKKKRGIPKVVVFILIFALLTFLAFLFLG